MMHSNDSFLTRPLQTLRRVSLAMIGVFLLLATAHQAQAQATCADEDGRRVCRVPQGVGTLNDAIESDTTDTGARVDTNTVYVLESGGTYILSGSVENRFPLTIVAEEGATERPRLVPGVDDGGNSSRAFRARSDLTLRGLYVTNEDELGGLNSRIIRVSADDARIVVENCHLDKDSQSAFRLDEANNRVFILNSIVSNIGTTDDPNNGRGVDDRSNPIDTLIVENSTFYNLTSRVLRDDGGPNNYVRFNHNTLVNIGQFGVSFGETREAIFTNNLVINAGFLGNAPGDTRDVVELDSLSDMTATQIVDIRNNNIHIDEDVLAAQPADSVTAVPFFSGPAQAYIDASGLGGTIIDEPIVFSLAPAGPAEVVSTFYAGAPVPLDDGLPEGALRVDPTIDVSPFDFLYSTTTQSGTGSTTGQPLGALSWFGFGSLPTAAEDEVETPDAFRLLGNYPNPFNPETTVLFELDVASEVTVAVYDLLGRQVLTAPTQPLAPGAASVRLDASPLASGVYLYRVTAAANGRTQVKTGRMVLLK